MAQVPVIFKKIQDTAETINFSTILGNTYTNALTMSNGCVGVGTDVIPNLANALYVDGNINFTGNLFNNGVEFTSGGGGGGSGDTSGDTSGITVQTINDMRITRGATVTKNYTFDVDIEVWISWSIFSPDDLDAFRVTGRAHIIASDTQYAYRRFEVLVTPVAGGALGDITKPRLLATTEANNHMTSAFTNLTTTVQRHNDFTVYLKVSYNSTLTNGQNRQSSLQLEVFAPAKLGDFTFSDFAPSGGGGS